VGERTFVTTRQTLVGESDFFAAMLSSRCNSALADGSFFVDADPDLFKHILQYLRRGVLPVFYDKDRGHDYALYAALLEEAKIFQIPRLETWLQTQGYLDAVKLETSAVELEGCPELETRLSTDRWTEYHPGWATRQVYVCPRGVFVHRGNPGACGKQCASAWGNNGDVFEEELFMRTLVVTKRIVFDMKACTAGR
jgi:hypothetical protein